MKLEQPKFNIKIGLSAQNLSLSYLVDNIVMTANDRVNLDISPYITQTNSFSKQMGELHQLLSNQYDEGQEPFLVKLILFKQYNLV